MTTPYSKDNGDFSNVAHRCAQKQLYPFIFGVTQERLSFEDTLLELNERGRVLDGEMAIDRIVKIKVDGLRLPLVFTVQERFRKPKYLSSQDITVTEWNKVTGKPSELYKIAANIFVYGYFDPSKQNFLDAVAVDVPVMLSGLACGELKYTTSPNPRSKQDFIALTFEDLLNYGCLLFWMHIPQETWMVIDKARKT